MTASTAFVYKVQAMRTAQKRWFRDHRPDDLTESKKLEREVDLLVADMLDLKDLPLFSNTE